MMAVELIGTLCAESEKDRPVYYRSIVTDSQGYSSAGLRYFYRSLSFSPCKATCGPAGSGSKGEET